MNGKETSLQVVKTETVRDTLREQIDHLDEKLNAVVEEKEAKGLELKVLQISIKWVRWSYLYM